MSSVKRILSIVVPLLLIANAPASSPERKVGVKELREDFAIFRTALETAHAGMYRYTPKAEMDALFANTEARLTAPMSGLEFMRLLATVEAAIKCGHSGVLPPKAVQDRVTKTEPLLPLAIRVIDGKVYCLRDLSGQNPGCAGQEILSINGAQTGAILKNLEVFMECDADVRSLKPYRLSGGDWRFNRSLYVLLGMRAPFRVKLKNEAGRVSSRLYPGTALPRLRQLRKASFPKDVADEPPTSLKFRDGGAMAVLTIRSFGGTADSEGRVSFSDFYDQAFAQMELKGTKALVIDLRGNGGGADDAGCQLLQHLMDRPFNYYAELSLKGLQFDFLKYGPPTQPRELPKGFAKLGSDGLYHNNTHPNVGTHDPAWPTFSGSLFVLTDGGSFSTTCEFTSNLRYRRKATFIGEETGGAFYGNNSGAVARVILPHTGVTFFVAMQKYVMAVSGEPKRRGVLPDVPVTNSIQDLLEGRDRVMNKALGLAERAASGA